jgi:hypothetical protein
MPGGYKKIEKEISQIDWDGTEFEYDEGFDMETDGWFVHRHFDDPKGVFNVYWESPDGSGQLVLRKGLLMGLVASFETARWKKQHWIKRQLAKGKNVGWRDKEAVIRLPDFVSMLDMIPIHTGLLADTIIESVRLVRMDLNKWTTIDWWWEFTYPEDVRPAIIETPRHVHSPARGERYVVKNPDVRSRVNPWDANISLTKAAQWGTGEVDEDIEISDIDDLDLDYKIYNRHDPTAREDPLQTATIMIIQLIVSELMVILDSMRMKAFIRDHGVHSTELAARGPQSDEWYNSDTDNWNMGPHGLSFQSGKWNMGETGYYSEQF